MVVDEYCAERNVNMSKQDDERKYYNQKLIQEEIKTS